MKKVILSISVMLLAMTGFAQDNKSEIVPDG